MSRRRRTARWVGLAFLLAIAVWVVYRLFSQQSEFGGERDFNPLLLPALSLVLVVLAVGLAGVVIRNLVRLIVERKRGILGARLRTKLVFFFLALVLLPATILFTGSAQVIKQTVEAILRTPLEDLTRQSREIVDEWSTYFQAQSLRRATAIAEEIRQDAQPSSSGRESLDRLLERWLRLDERQLIRITRGDRVLAEAGGLEGALHLTLRDELEALTRAIVEDVAREGSERVTIDYLGNGLLVQAAVPVDPGAAPPPDVVSVARAGAALRHADRCDFPGHDLRGDLARILPLPTDHGPDSGSRGGHEGDRLGQPGSARGDRCGRRDGYAGRGVQRDGRGAAGEP
jgi:hypothetical protein